MKHRPTRHYKNGKRSIILATSWAKLPLPALVEVMGYLSDRERIACAQVCRHWQDAFESPILWRQRGFEFGGSRFRPLGQKSALFAKTLGRYIRNLRIICRQLTSHTCESMVGYMDAFLETLTSHGPPVLNGLEIEGLELEFWRYKNLRDLVANSLIKFFRSQKNLKKFRMPNAQLALLPGVDMMEALASGNGDTLETLLIEHFFQSRLPVYQMNRFTNAMQKFTSLHTVAINYCCINEELVTAWAESLRGSLESLRIRCCDNEPFGHVISNAAWGQLTSSCPNLKADIGIYGIGSSRDILPILSPSIPLRNFSLFTGYDNGTELGLSAVLTHIATSYNKTLIALDLEFDNYHDNVNDALVVTVTRCRNLTDLKVKAQMDIEVARYICRMVDEGRTHLSRVDLMLCDISPLQMEQLQDLRDDMNHVVQDQRIELSLRDDLYS